MKIDYQGNSYIRKFEVSSNNNRPPTDLINSSKETLGAVINDLLLLPPLQLKNLLEAVRQITSSTSARKILLIAKTLGFVYSSLVPKLFPETKKQNAAVKIRELTELEVLERITPAQLAGSKTFSLVLSYLLRTSGRDPQELKRAMKLYRITPVYLPLVEKLLIPSPEEFRVISNWKALLGFGKAENVLVKSLKGEHYTSRAFAKVCAKCGKPLNTHAYFIVKRRLFVCDLCKRKILSMDPNQVAVKVHILDEDAFEILPYAHGYGGEGSEEE